MRRIGPWTALLIWAIGLAGGCSNEPPAQPPAALAVDSFLERLDTATIVSPTGELETVEARRIVAGGEERVAILAHAPVDVVFNVTVPPGAWLDAGAAVSEAELLAFPNSNGLRMAVWIADGTVPPQIVWSADFPGRPTPWADFTVPLEAWEGRRIQIGFRSDPLGDPSGDFAAWSRPVIRIDPGLLADRVVGPAPTIPARRIEQDLLDHPDLKADGCTVRIPGVTVPTEGSLDLAIQALRDPDGEGGLLGPVRTEVRVDGETIYRRIAGSFGTAITLPARIDLTDYANRTVDIEFDVCDDRVGNSLIWAKRLWLAGKMEIQRQTPEDGWNLLFVLVDTVRADRLGHYGYSRPTTPNWDAIAAHARVYDQATAPSSWTQPSVTTLFTGLSPIEHGVIEGVPLPIRTLTLPEVLQREGFTTLGVSSNPIVGALEGFHRGFESFVQAPWMRADRIDDLFIDWLDRAQDQRWFAYLHYIDPHAPYDAPGAYSSSFTEGCSTPWASEPGMHQLSEAINFGRGDAEHTDADIDCLSDLYDGELLFFDRQLGRLVDALQRRGQLERTLLVITSDHGEEFMEHGRILHGYDLYQETVHVPLTVLVPQGKPARIAEPVALVDLPEALFHWLGVSRPGSSEDGPKLLRPVADDPIFTHTTEAWKMGTGFTVLSAIREGDSKLIYRPDDGAEEIYNLVTDPQEIRNLVDQPDAVSPELRERLMLWLSGAKSHTMQTRGMDDETVEKLRSLGYVK